VTKLAADIRNRLRSLFRRERVETDLDAELRFHFDEHVAKLERDGLPHNEALRQARLAIGSPDSIKEEHRDARGVQLFEVFAQDVRFSFRILAKNWKLAAIATFSLAVAMALATVGLGVANGVLFRPPVAAHPENLVEITASTPTSSVENFSYIEYTYFRDHAQSFDALAAFPYQISKAPLVLGDQRDVGMTELVSDNYFQTLGLTPAQGELFHPGADASRAPLAVLSYARWQRWGADPEIVGKSVIINSHAVTIAGVAPENFTGTAFGFGVDAIESLGTQASFSDPHFFTDGQNRWLILIGRLKPGVSRERAAAEMRGLSAQLAADHPDTNKDRVAIVGTLSVLPPDSRSAGAMIAGLLVAIVLLVLLIACANVANLLLGMGTGRKQEILVRTALGATRGRLVRQLLTESLMLCVAGGLAGFTIAAAVLARFARFQAAVPVIGSFDMAVNFRADAGVAFFTLVLILGASLAAGLAPALHASVPNLASAISGEGVVGGTRKGILRNALVAVQVAVCTLVMVGVGLCYRSVRNLENVHTGFDIQHLGGVLIDLAQNGYDDEHLPVAYDRIRSAVREIPGAQSVSLSIDLPLMNDSWYGEDVEVPSATGAAAQKAHISRTIVDENYFTTLDIPLIAGRAFLPNDTPSSPAVAIVSRAMAETYWPGESAVGKQFMLSPTPNGSPAPATSGAVPPNATQKPSPTLTPVTIVGVADDSIYNSLDEAPKPVIYFSLGQRRESFVIATVRAAGNPRPLLSPFAEKLGAIGIHSDLTPFTGGDLLTMALLIPSITLYVILALGALALMLAVMGVYGAIFYSVNERRREIGIRVALGAGNWNLAKLFLRQSAIVAGCGVAAGVALGVAATILFRAQFFGIAPVEFHVLVPVAAAMMALALLISYAAARPWIDVSPLDSVRHS
jgi:putative ABC transport system permease protein